MKHVLYGLVCATAILLSNTANATLLSYEGFDYTTGQALNTQNGGLGWSGNAWGAEARYTIVPGLSLSDYAVSGNAVQMNDDTGTTNTQLLANRQVASTENPSTLWYSYLYRPDSTVDSSYSGLQLHTTTTNPDASRLRSANRGWNVATGGVGVDNGLTRGTQDFTDSTPYLVISKFSGLNGTSIEGKWWSLRAGEYDAIKAGGITEAELDATNYDNATETVALSYAFDTSKYVQIQWVTSNAATQAGTFDELRHATQLDDLFVAIPEPSSATLLGLGIALLAGLRRRFACN